MVEVKNLCKKYGDFVALDDLNFDVADGEVFGFVGPNGAGKTTTMRIMAGLNQPDRGSITIAGTDAVKNSKKIKRIIVEAEGENNTIRLDTEGMKKNYYLEVEIDPDTNCFSTKSAFEQFNKEFIGDEIIEVAN